MAKPSPTASRKDPKHLKALGSVHASLAVSVVQSCIENRRYPPHTVQWCKQNRGVLPSPLALCEAKQRPLAQRRDGHGLG